MASRLGRHSHHAFLGTFACALLAFGAVACEGDTEEKVAAESRSDERAKPADLLPVVGEDLCDFHAAIETENGYRIQNNVWNPDASTTQCVTPRAGGDRVGFDVHGKPSSSESAPASYPSIVYGWHFSTWTAGTGPEFEGQATLPVKVSENRPVPASWSITTTETGRYNTSYDLWLHPQADPGGNPNGGLEMMIWVHFQGDGVAPSGVRGGGAQVEGRSWSTLQGWNEEISQNWDYVAYQMACRADHTELDLNEFLQHAVSQGWLDPEWYLISVQAGFEIWGGGEGLGVDGFHVEVGE